MLFLDISNLSKIAPEHGLTDVEISGESVNIADFLDRIEARNQGFYKIIDDFAPLKAVQEFAAKSDFEHVVVCGIGGSSLGGICLEQSLGHLFRTKLHFLDNIDPILLREAEDVIDYSKTLFIIISKSGTTPEIEAQYQYFRGQLETRNLPLKDHLVFITDPETGVLRKIANEEGITTFDIPPNVGGRFSVLTPVGLLPAALQNYKIEDLLKGAQQVRDRFLMTDWTANFPFTLATIQYLLSQKGKTITVMFPYAQKLIRLADWYRQLLAESIGKAVDNEGKTVNAGLTPVNALGVTDQHSQSQLYNEGPNDKLFIFIEVQDLGPSLKIPGKPYDFQTLLKTELDATRESLTQNNRPFVTIKIPSISEETLGELFMLFEASIAFLGEFFNIDAFNQPGVELSKQLTKANLSG